jgi:hypothetical protein
MGAQRHPQLEAHSHQTHEAIGERRGSVPRPRAGESHAGTFGRKSDNRGASDNGHPLN